MLKLVIAAAAALVASAAVAYAGSAGDDHAACKNNVNGNVRVDDSCRPNETAITLGGGGGAAGGPLAYARITADALDPAHSAGVVSLTRVDWETSSYYVASYCFDLVATPNVAVSSSTLVPSSSASLPVRNGGGGGGFAYQGDAAMASLSCPAGTDVATASFSSKSEGGTRPAPISAAVVFH